MPTTLAAGDLAIIGINADNPDVFSFVLLTDIDSGTEIFFTDNGVSSDGSLRTSEGTVKYTAPTAITAGTVIQFTGTSGDFSTENGLFALAADGDQVIAYQETAAAPTFIYAAQTNSTQFQTGSNGTNQSDLPPGLAVGTTAVAVGSGSGAGDEFDNSTYNETVTSGSQAALLTAISNAANWTGNDTGPIALADGPFTVNGGNQAPVLSGNATFTAIGEDGLDTANLGNTVTELASSLISDANFDPEGIAITSVDNTNGTWQYSTDGGSNWQNIDAAASDSNAVTLGARSLYTNTLSNPPNSQGELSFTNLNLAPLLATETTASSGTILDTTASQDIYAGYSNYSSPSLVSPGLPTLVNPGFPILDNTVGYEISFTMQLLEESRTNQSRAGFSIIAISQDTTKAIELGFQKTSATTGNIFAQGGPAFVAAENVSFNTTESTNYTLAIKDDAYTLSANGTSILTGSLRDYTNFVGAIDPYETPNFIFLGDDTTSAQGSFVLSQVAVQTETRIRFVPNADYSGDATLQFRAWDTTDGSDNGDTGIDTSTNGTNTAFSSAISAGTITVQNAPEVSSITLANANPTNADSASFAITFSEAVSGVDSNDFALTTTGTTTGTINSVTGTGANYTVTVNGISGSGTLNLEVVDNDSITNSNSLALGGSGTSGAGDGSSNFGSTYKITETTTVSPNPGTSGDEIAPVVGNTETLEIVTLNSFNTLTLALDQLSLDTVSELIIYGNNTNSMDRTLIDSVSLLESGQLPSSYAPTFSLPSDSVETGQLLQFELVSNGINRIATLSSINNEQVQLTFDESTALIMSLDNRTGTTDLITGDAEAINFTEQSGIVSLRFEVYREAAFNNTIGFYTTADASGSVRDPLTSNLLQPGDAGYKEAALSQQVGGELTGINGQVTTFSMDIEGGTYLGTFLIADGSNATTSEVYFSYGAANSGDDHVKHLGNNTFGFEDIARLGDADFNDVVVQFEVI
ncbi:MAG: DUF4114 domain-containing protein [Cyanobacteria bacterium P01_D01_bin.156]